MICIILRAYAKVKFAYCVLFRLLHDILIAVQCLDPTHAKMGEQKVCVSFSCHKVISRALVVIKTILLAQAFILY